MTFHQDQLREDIRAEEHSFATIAVVSVFMIAAAMVSLLVVL